jgi:CHAT domain-containing protein/Tfp pilus assembly protein PilF
MFPPAKSKLLFRGFWEARFFASLLLVCLAATTVYSQSSVAPEVTVLEIGKPIEREIAGGQKHNFQVSLSENQYAKITLEQRGVDVVARVLGADGKLLTEFDSVITKQGTEEIEIVALAAGNYRLEIETKLKNAPAARYEIRLAELRVAAEADISLNEARTLFGESVRLARAGKHEESLRLAERVLEIREKFLGAEHAAVAATLSSMGVTFSDMGDGAKAESFFKRAAAIYEKRFGADAINVCEPLNNLGVMYKERGEFAAAEAIYQRILAIREKTLGADHTLVAAVLNNLGVLYRARGNFTKAEQMYERALAIRARLFGPDHPDLASVLVNLASLNYFKGDFAAALKLDQRVLEIREKNLAPDHPGIAHALTNLGLLYTETNEPEKAEPLFRRALEIYEKRFGPDSVNSTMTLNNLAQLYFDQGNFAKAEPLFVRSLQIAEKNPAASFSALALYLNNLGSFYTFKGDYERAETYLKRALGMREKALGEDHHDVGRTCAALARLYAFKGDAAQALAFQTRANRINEKNIALNLSVGTEHKKLSYMSLMAEDLNQTVALHAQMNGDNSAALEQALTTLLQRKGRVLDAMTDNLAVLRRRFDAQDQSLFDSLNDANARLAELALSAPRRITLAEHQKQIAALEEQKDRLETEISRRTAGFYERSQQQPITLAAVQKLIPNDAALVEFAVYRPIEKAKEGKSPYAAPRYVAYVVRNQGAPRWAELGAAQEIEARVDALRRALRDPKRMDAEQLARALDEKIMQPVRALLGDAKHLLVSPDGALNLIPFEALADENGNYLVENYSFTYLTGGRDLLRMQTPRASKSKPLVVADPTFGEPSSELISKVADTRKNDSRGDGGKRRRVTATRSLADVYFTPLVGSAQEARAIQTIFPDAVFLTGARATESGLRQANAPQILHIATHGFFLEDNKALFADFSRGGSSAVKTKIENPLLRSGLALAGANRRGAAGEDGILTALEASGLNLWGTKLVVLSACDTGIGEVKNGEGVYGLRRAFALAGAESMVMSFWAVSDFVTRELMTNYYKNLKQGMGRGAALRQVQLEMLKKNGRRHPFYWASFIQSGEWANLDGKR